MAGNSRIVIDFDKIYMSNSCGPFKIIKDLGRDQRSRLYVRIKFLETGTEKDVRYDIAMDGKINDDLYGIDFNRIYESLYYGPFKILKFVDRNYESKKIVRIKFLNTGYETDVLLREAKSGAVKDKTVKYHDRKFCNYNQNYDNHIIYVLKQRWQAMMDRCYNPNSESYYNYGALGVTVCDLWHNKEKYILSMPHIPYFWKFYYNPKDYSLDKDYLQLSVPTNKRIYSPETCIFLSIYDNSNLAFLQSSKNNKEYYGIQITTDNNYDVRFSIYGKRYHFGIYNNLNAALNEYNYYYSLYGNYELIPLLNKIDKYMTHEEAQQYLVSK